MANWAEILEEKNARIAELEKELEWAFNMLKPPIVLKDRKLPAVIAVRERLGKLLGNK